jgi:lipopolysaccharide transport system ATP-binding protein
VLVACCALVVLAPGGAPPPGRRTPPPPRGDSGRVSLHVDFAATLQRGVYRLRLRLVLAPNLDHARVLSRYDAGLSFEILDDCRGDFTGLFPLPMRVHAEAGATDA